MPAVGRIRVIREIASAGALAGSAGALIVPTVLYIPLPSQPQRTSSQPDESDRIDLHAHLSSIRPVQSMARALPSSVPLPPAIALVRGHRLRATEPLMSGPARRRMSGAVGMLLAAAAAGPDSHPAQAQSADCVTERPVQAPEGTHWVGRWELNNYRRCWVLVDEAGRELAAPVPAPPVNPPRSARPSVGDVTGASTPQSQSAPASPRAASPRRREARPDGPHRVATASKPARSEPPKSEEHPVKPDENLPPDSLPDRDTLYAQFLKSKGRSVKAESLPDPDALYAQFLEYLRWREQQKRTGTR